MFRKTRKERQLDLFYSPSNLLGDRALKKYNDPNAWHNIFYKEITSRIDEDVFSVLFDKGNGAPNASVCLLVAMTILKDGFGCSDEQLFERCEFDIQVRKALGLDGFEDEIPCAATYYNFNAAVLGYDMEHGTDLIGECFERITRGQAKEYAVSGRTVRMDSKLIGSNIALYSRYVLVHKTMCAALKLYDVSTFDEPLRQSVGGYLKEDSAKTVYRTDKEAMKTKLQLIGECVHGILTAVGEKAEGFTLLRRAFNEQFKIVDGKVVVRPKKEIPADSLQNPNDPDATYRNKNDKPVQGYSANITETCGEEGKPSLITGVRVETATHADCNFLQDAVAQSERVTGDKVEELHADGAYQSPANRDFADSHFLAGGETIEDVRNNPEHKVMELMTGKMQGGARFYLYRDGDDLTIVDTETGETHKGILARREVYKGKSGEKKWRIPWNVEGGKPWRYFTEEDVRRSELRRKIESLPEEKQRMRNNIEAAMFQYSFHTRNNKTRYRGLAKHRMHAYTRCLWMNFRRLAIYQNLSENHLFLVFLDLIWLFLMHPKNLFSKIGSRVRTAADRVCGGGISEPLVKNLNFATF